MGFVLSVGGGGGGWSCPRLGGYTGQGGLACFVGASQAFPQANPEFSGTRHTGEVSLGLCAEWAGALPPGYIAGWEQVTSRLWPWENWCRGGQVIQPHQAESSQEPPHKSSEPP